MVTIVVVVILVIWGFISYYGYCIYDVSFSNYIIFCFNYYGFKVVMVNSFIFLSL